MHVWEDVKTFTFPLLSGQNSDFDSKNRFSFNSVGIWIGHTAQEAELEFEFDWQEVELNELQ